MKDLSSRGWVRRNRRDFLRVAGGSGAYLSALSTLSPSLLSQARDYGPPAWIPLEELENRLQQFGRQHPNLMKLEVVGKSVEGRSLWVATLTDFSVADETKEHVLLTTLHSGIERIGPSSLLYLMHWLLSGHPLAREMLRKQKIVCLPIVNPDGYVSGSFHNKNDLDPYNSWTLEGPMEPAKNPEAMAVKRIMDELQPEVHGDMHGSILDFQGSIHADTSAAYSNVSLRPYHHEIMRLMNEAALEEGYPADWLEEDSERIFWGPELDPIRDKVWKGRPRIYAAIYCYNRYHSIVTANENAWERSALLRYRRLLQIGNEVWPGEYFPGYPTRVIMGNDLHRLIAYGVTADQRRKSRVELWNKTRQITFGFDWPETEGMILCFCATSPTAVRKWLGDATLNDMAERIKEHPGFRSADILRLVKLHPGEDSKRPAAFLTEGGGAKYYRMDQGPDSLDTGKVSSIENGLGIRLRIPYHKAKLLDLQLNGHPVSRSESDGYVSWVARGFFNVQVNISPERTKKEDFFLVTCEYDPRERRTQGKATWEGK